MSLLLNQHEAAVELALKIDTDLAASCAAGKMARQPLPEETSKKLWLKVMRNEDDDCDEASSSGLTICLRRARAESQKAKTYRIARFSSQKLSG